MKWIKYSEKKPEDDCLCLTINDRIARKAKLCKYYKDHDVFLFLANVTSEACYLDVTHYFIVPEFNRDHNGI